MIAIDTNVLVRYFVQDEPVQTARAAKLIEQSAERGEPIFLSVLVLAEFAWVIRQVYEIPKAELTHALERLLEVSDEAAEPAFVIQDRALVRNALDAYAAGRGDFADHLIGAVARAAGASTTYTFDRAASSLSSFKLLRSTEL